MGNMRVLFILFAFAGGLVTAGDVVDLQSQKSEVLVQKARAYLFPEAGKKRDRSKAMDCLKIAADRGDAQAESMLGRLLLDFCYTTYSPQKGLELLQSARKKGCHANDFLIGLELTAPTPYQKNGTDIYFSSFSSRYFSLEDIFHLKVRDKRSVYGDQLSMLYDYAEIRTYSLEKLKKLADKGDINAGILWAFRVTQNLKFDKQTEEAEQFLWNAVNQGYEWAALVLASHLRISGQVRKLGHDQMLALTDPCLSLFLFAAEQQLNEAASLALGAAVSDSLSGKHREIPSAVLEKGLNDMKKRARYKLDGTIYFIGQMYLWGVYVPQNEQEGVRWLDMLALTGDSTACDLLCFYFSGKAPKGKIARNAVDMKKVMYYSSLSRRTLESRLLSQ